MKVVDQARQVLAKLKDYGGWEGVGLYVPESGDKNRKQLSPLCEREDLIGILEAAIPALEEQEKRQELIHAFRAANKPGQIIAAPDERAERRTLAIAQIAAAFMAIPSIHSNPSKKVDEAIAAAVELLEVVEKRG